MHGCYTLLLQDGDGQTLPTHSISAGLDYPAIAPQHAALHESGRCSYGEVDDATALEAFQLLCRAEGVIPALESSHALGYFLQAEKPKAERVIINLSGRGDKDLPMLRGY
jgi:tryptophan synthase beta subunit